MEEAIPALNNHSVCPEILSAAVCSAPDRFCVAEGGLCVCVSERVQGRGRECDSEGKEKGVSLSSLALTPLG